MFHTSNTFEQNQQQTQSVALRQMNTIYIVLYIAVVFPVLCICSNDHLDITFVNFPTKQRHLAESKPMVCGSKGPTTCTCKTFLDNLKKDAFTKVNQTVWEKYQTTPEYKKVLEKEATDQKCGKSIHEEKSCGLTFPKFPEDKEYSKACSDIGGHLCEGTVAVERCTKYDDGTAECSRVTYKRMTYPGDSVSFCCCCS